MQLIITITVILTTGLLVIAGIVLLFSPELLICFNKYIISWSKKKPILNKGKYLSIDVFIITINLLFNFYTRCSIMEHLV